ncbi:MAG: hypothetical protein MUO52_04370, partial [Desulfobacterales bacterium]|nr:hypothetical protein [Desulfobacterales bacterium]
KGPEGYVVFVAKGDNVVEVRPVIPGLSTGEETQVEKGVNPGERVVIDGQLALYPGAAVVEKKVEPSAKGQEKKILR